ncbi:hypothetical protein EC917_14113 [Bacillus thuringiensis]|uniref:Uncharacterized protein n=1 Tax=Bacillus thuringiensis TaxID=1428 RepID=A0A4R4AWQ4_BACTU|nr:hypothetical protein EC917_14113 [Bacillus thuringiensis]TCW44443.1 hypothetical protein EC910_1407 [Bacillus thuringiensis]
MKNYRGKGKITFERVYEIGDVYYIGDKKGNLFILDKDFTPVSRQSANVERTKKSTDDAG